MKRENDKSSLLKNKSMKKLGIHNLGKKRAVTELGELTCNDKIRPQANSKLCKDRKC